MATVYNNANRAAACCSETKRYLRKYNRQVEGMARANLAAQHTTTRITESGHYFPASITTEEHDVDVYTLLIATNAMALEFGHAPSGAFEGTDTQAPEPTYILTRAAYGGHTIS